MPRPSPWVRPHIHSLNPYLPGEQPQGKDLIKLNTNENPYGPSPRVLRAVKAAVSERLRLYPSPAADDLRARLAELHQCDPDQIIIGNGSDELLALATRAFVVPWTSRGSQARSTIQYFTPSYSLYPVLAAIHGGLQHEVPLTKQFGIPFSQRAHEPNWNPEAALSFVTTPNAPSGRGYRTSELRRLCRTTERPLILDEAYVDFAKENALELVAEFDHVLVSRTFSKAYSLCFQRIGYFIGPPTLIEALHKVRDSYNVNGLAQVAAGATLDDLPYYRANFRRIIKARQALGGRLEQMGFQVLPSATNFLLVKPPRRTGSARWWHQALRERGILVRWFSAPNVDQFLRITIGNPEENRVLTKVVRNLVSNP